MVFSVLTGSIALTGTAAATINTASVDADPAVAGASANHHIEFETGASDSLKEITLTYDQTDVQSVGSGNIEVMYGGESLGISDASGDGTSTLTITLQQSVSVSSGEMVTINSTGEAFVNPDSTGDYSVDVAASDGSTEWGTATATLTIGSVGDEPAVTGDSELGSGATQTYNESTSSTLQYQSASMGSDVTVMQGNRTLFTETPTYETESDGTYTYNVSIPDDFSAYDGLELGANETETLTYKIDGNTSDENSTVKTGEFEVSNDETQAFIASENPVSQGSSGLLGGFSTSSLTFWSNDTDTESTEDVGTTLSTDTVNVTNNTETVTLDTVDSNMTTALATSTEDASEGDLIWSSYSQLNGQFVPTFYAEADEDTAWLNTSEDAHAVVSEDGEEVTYHNVNSLTDSGTSELSINTVGDDNLGLRNSAKMFSNFDDASWVQKNIGAFGALCASGRSSGRRPSATPPRW